MRQLHSPIDLLVLKAEGVIFAEGTSFAGVVVGMPSFQEAVFNGNADFTGALMTGANFIGAKAFNGAKLTFKGADLRKSDLSYAKMPGADFTQANLTRCDCNAADLSGSIFDRTLLQGAEFEDAHNVPTSVRAAQSSGKSQVQTSCSAPFVAFEPSTAVTMSCSTIPDRYSLTNIK